MVSFHGDKTLLYKTNLACRTALRILKPIYKFEASNPDEVYEKMKAFEWDTLLSPETTFSIDSVTYSDCFKHSKFVTYRAKDAIADYFMEKTGKRPSVRLNGAELVLNLHISHMSCTLSLDSSGESLQARIPRGTNRSPHQRSIGRQDDIENRGGTRNRLYRTYVRVGNHSHRSRFDRHPYISRYFQEKFRFRKMERFRRRAVRNALQRR